jgi:hypothetical protein
MSKLSRRIESLLDLYSAAALRAIAADTLVMYDPDSPHRLTDPGTSFSQDPRASRSRTIFDLGDEDSPRQTIPSPPSDSPTPPYDESEYCLINILNDEPGNSKFNVIDYLSYFDNKESYNLDNLKVVSRRHIDSYHENEKKMSQALRQYNLLSLPENEKHEKVRSFEERIGPKRVKELKRECLKNYNDFLNDQNIDEFRIVAQSTPLADYLDER